MRKLLINAFAASLLAVVSGGLAMSAHADSTCGVGTGPTAGQFTDSDGNSGVQICIDGTGVADGTVTLAGKPNTDNPPASTGYIAADGKSSNPSVLGGYIGVQSGDDAGVVGCAASGSEFNPAEADETAGDDAAESPQDENNSILRLDGTPPTVPPDPSDPCSPPAPAP